MSVTENVQPFTYIFFLYFKTLSKRHSIHAPNVTDELCPEEERRLNQFDSGG